MPLSTLIAGGLAAGGALGGFLSRPDKVRRGDVNPDPNGLALERFNELRDPTHMFSQFRTMGKEAAGSADQFLQSTAALGGSERLAQARHQSSQNRATKQALDSFRQFRLGANRQANQALNMHFGNERFTTQMVQQADQGRSATTQSLFNNLAGIGSTILGRQLGSGALTDGGLFGNGGSTSLQKLRQQNARAAQLEHQYAGFRVPAPTL